MLLKRALDRYLTEVVPTKRPSTQRREQPIDVNLKAALGDHSLAALTPDIVAGYRDQRLDSALFMPAFIVSLIACCKSMTAPLRKSPRVLTSAARQHGETRALNSQRSLIKRHEEEKHVPRIFFAAIMFALSCAPAHAQMQACFNLYQLTDYEHAVEPGIEIDASDSLPQHCVVRGVINRAINFEVRLPMVGWNGRFLMLGTGGSSGYVADTRAGLAQGFAVSSTDTGHQGVDLAFGQHPEARLDYAFRGVHLAARSSKKVIERFYGKKIESSFYGGCSNGGRQGLIEATRFPEDFDGIVAAAPAFAPVKHNLPWNAMASRAQHAGPLTADHIQLLDDTSRASCDLLDGVEDGIINDPRLCTQEHYDPGTLLCKEGQDPSTCLTQAQLDNVRQHYRGVVDVRGNVITPGLMPGAEAGSGWSMWALTGFINPDTGEPLEKSISQMSVENRLRTWVYQNQDYDPATFDIRANRGDLARASAILDVNSADLARFRERGGKLLLVQGWNDYPVRPAGIINYLKEIEAANGGAAPTREFVRLFMVPGMGHCGGGPGAHVFDYVSPLVAWVDEGKAPEELIGGRPDGAFTRRHCVFPSTARYTGGDVNDAASYRCMAPP